MTIVLNQTSEETSAQSDTWKHLTKGLWAAGGASLLGLLAYAQFKTREQQHYLNTLPTVSVSLKGEIPEGEDVDMGYLDPISEIYRNRVPRGKDTLGMIADSNPSYAIIHSHKIGSPHIIFKLASGNDPAKDQIIGDSYTNYPQTVNEFGSTAGITRIADGKTTRWEPYVQPLNGKKKLLSESFTSTFGPDCLNGISSIRFNHFSQATLTGSATLHRKSIPFVMNLNTGEVVCLPTLTPDPCFSRVISSNGAGHFLGRELPKNGSSSPIYVLWDLSQKTSSGNAHIRTYNLNDVLNKSLPLEENQKLVIDHAAEFSPDGLSIPVVCDQVDRRDEYIKFGRGIYNIRLTY